MEEELSYLTMILLLTGKYHCKRAPMGLSSSADEWNMRSDAAVVCLEGIAKEVDDILIQAPDYPTLWRRLQLGWVIEMGQKKLNLNQPKRHEVWHKK